MKCETCSRPSGRACLGERLGHLCGRPDYREYLAGFDAEAAPPVEAAEVAAPGPLAMAMSFLGAMRGLVADRGRLAPRDVRRARRAACESCPFHVASPDSCSKCGCGSVVPGGLAAKIAIASSRCPDDPPRWGPA